MVGSIKGYCLLKSTEHVFIGLNKNFNGELYNEVEKSLIWQPLKILDIAVNKNGFLCLAPTVACIIDVRDMSDVALWFECEQIGDILCPPNLLVAEQMLYQTKWLGKPYTNHIKRLIIIKSLIAGKFDDANLSDLSAEELKDLSNSIKDREDLMKQYNKNK